MRFFSLNLLNAVYKKRFFPLVLQIFTLLFFAFLIYGAWGISATDKGLVKILRNTNLSNLIVWSYWWPMVVFVAVIAGRHWCTICPMELVASFTSRIGLRRKPGSLLKSGWIITLFYGITLILGIHTFAIHRLPHRMAIYMLMLLGFTVLVSLIWEKRTFCSYICPVGHLLGLYSLLSITEWRVKDQKICSECKSKDCVDKRRNYNLTARSCTSELYPAQIKDNRKCVLCSQCLTSCPNDNIGLRMRKPLFDLFSHLKLSGAEVLFIMMVSGFVVYEILSEGKTTKSLLLVVPNTVFSLFPQGVIPYGPVKAIVLFIVIPALFFALFSLLRSRVAKETVWNSISAIAIAVLPIMGCMHLLKAMLKTTSRVPYWSHVFYDYRGVETANAIVNGTLQLNSSFLSFIHPALVAASIFLPLLGLVLSGWIIMKRREYLVAKVITLFAALTYAMIFEIGILTWYI